MSFLIALILMVITSPGGVFHLHKFKPIIQSVSA